MDALFLYVIPAIGLLPVVLCVIFGKMFLAHPAVRNALRNYVLAVVLTFIPLLGALVQYLVQRPVEPDWFQGWGWLQVMFLVPGSFIWVVLWFFLCRQMLGLYREQRSA